MLKGTISIDGDDYLLGDSWAVERPPLEGYHRHLLLHFLIQDEGRLSSEHVIDTDCAVEGALGQVLVSWVESDVEGLSVKITHGPLMGYLDGRVLNALECELFGERSQVLLLLLLLLLHHGWR